MYVMSYVGVKASINRILSNVTPKLHSEMILILLKVNLLLGRIYMLQKVTFRYAILGVMLEKIQFFRGLNSYMT